jgi:hypothetical protein
MAVRFGKPIIDVGVADGRQSLAGTMRYWLPECADWSACPACHLTPNTATSRDEGLLFTILVTTASLASHVFVSLVTELDTDLLRTHNYVTVEMTNLRIERLAVLKRERCPVCRHRAFFA